ncbi:MAG TPA: hypothetical protein VIK18_06170 [Pirellulales bacterium]
MPNEVQTVSFSPVPTAGTYTLAFYGQTISALNWNDPAATIQAALEALSTIGAGNISATGEVNAGSISMTFQGSLANVNVPQTTCDASGLNCAGSIDVVSETTAGSGPTDVPATGATAIGTLVNGPSGNSPATGYWQLGDDNYGTNLTGVWDSGVTGSGQEPPNPFNGLMMDDGTGSGGQTSWDGTISLSFTDGTDDSTTGANEVQTLPQPTADAGTFTVTGTEEATSDLDYAISMADLQTALNALSDIAAAGGVTVTGSDGGPWIVTWNSYGPQPLLSVDGSGLTQPSTATASTATEGGISPVYGSVLRSALISCERICA